MKKERYIEWINYYLEKANEEQVRLVFFFTKNLIE